MDTFGQHLFANTRFYLPALLALIVTLPGNLAILTLEAEARYHEFVVLNVIFAALLFAVLTSAYRYWTKMLVGAIMVALLFLIRISMVRNSPVGLDILGQFFEMASFYAILPVLGLYLILCLLDRRRRSRVTTGLVCAVGIAGASVNLATSQTFGNGSWLILKDVEERASRGHYSDPQELLEQCRFISLAKEHQHCAEIAARLNIPQPCEGDEADETVNCHQAVLTPSLRGFMPRR